MILQDDLQSPNEELDVGLPPLQRTEPITPPPDLNLGGNKGKNKTGIIVGVVVAVVAVIAIVVVVVIIIRKKRNAHSSDVNIMNTNDNV